MQNNKLLYDEYDHDTVQKAYQLAQEQYAGIGIDTEKVLKSLSKIPISIHCWQGDDVSGFEGNGELTGGIQATGSYPGKARTAEELRTDLEKALSLIPGKHRLNLHAIYAEIDSKEVERDQLRPEHFQNWVNWAREKEMGLDFNPTCFSHPLSEDGFTLSHPDERIRQFWIDHCIAARKIGEYFGKELGTAAITNIWIPDGYKDNPVDRYEPRERLKDSLDQIFSVEIDQKYNLDSVESKLFGIGSEAYVVGSHEFYLGYAVKNNKLLCLDAGHFHPTEMISNKISAVLLYLDQILLHVSRPVRWDSDHVVILDDELREIAREIVRPDFQNRIHIGLDFFDASINRIAAWVIGTRNMIKALLIAMLEPTDRLKELEEKKDYTARLALMEEYRAYPWGAVWDYYCMQKKVPARGKWLEIVKEYEQKILAVRN